VDSWGFNPALTNDVVLEAARNQIFMTLALALALASKVHLLALALRAALTIVGIIVKLKTRQPMLK